MGGGFRRVVVEVFRTRLVVLLVFLLAVLVVLVILVPVGVPM